MKAVLFVAAFISNVVRIAVGQELIGASDRFPLVSPQLQVFQPQPALLTPSTMGAYILHRMWRGKLNTELSLQVERQSLIQWNESLVTGYYRGGLSSAGSALSQAQGKVPAFGEFSVTGHRLWCRLLAEA